MVKTMSVEQQILHPLRMVSTDPFPTYRGTVPEEDLHTHLYLPAPER